MSMQPLTRHTMQPWLEQRARVAGVLAWGIRLADRSTINRAFRDGFPDAAMDNAWRCVAEIVQVLRAQRLLPQRLGWIFQHYRLDCALRADGTLFGALSAPPAQELDGAQLHLTFEDFLALQQDGTVLTFAKARIQWGQAPGETP
jgi:hypothetical protein